MKKIVCFLLFFLLLNFTIFPAVKVHNLKEGETLWRLSKIYNISLDELCKYNNITDVTKVKMGTKIKIPDNPSKISNTTTNPSMQKLESVKVDKKRESPPKNLNYYDFKLPIDGDLKIYVTSHYRGLMIFSDVYNMISSISKGEVIYIDNISGYGNTMIIKDQNGFIFTYSGFSTFSVKKGEYVDVNTILGKSGQLSRYSRNGILLSIQHKDKYLKFDMDNKKFYL